MAWAALDWGLPGLVGLDELGLLVGECWLVGLVGDWGRGVGEVES